MGTPLFKDLYPNFSRSEFACKGICCCGASSPIDDSLVEGLQELRDILGHPLKVTSGFRCVTRNKEIGGAEKSMHIYGKAADISCTKVSPKDLARAAEDVEVFKNGGIGTYSQWVHVDIRSNGPARWGNQGE